MDDFIVQLIARLDASKTSDDIKKIEQQLNAKGIKLKPVIDSATSKQEIQNLAKQLQVILSSQNLNVDTSKIISAINQAAKETSKIYKTSELDKQGKIYIQKVSNTIEKTKSTIISKMKTAGYLDIEIKGLEKANGQIKSLTVSATDATGALKQLTFAQKKIIGSGKAQSGLVQTDNVKILGNISGLTATTSARLDKLKTKWSEQGILVGEFKNKVEQLETALSSVSSKASLQNLNSQFKNLNMEADSLLKANKIQLSFDNGTISTQIDSIRVKFEKLGFTQDEIAQKMSSVSNSYSNLQAAISSGDNNSILAANDRYNHSLQETENLYKQIKTNSDLYYNSAKQAKLTNDIQNWLTKNSAATKNSKNELQQYLELLGGGRVNVTTLKNIQSRLQTIDTSMRAIGKLGKSFSQTFSEGIKKFSYWTSSTFLVMKTVQEIKESITAVRELDTALVDLRKTSTMSASQLKEFYFLANDTAKQMGVTTKEIIDQASAWSRLGFSSQEAATQMAKLSSQFKLISPGMTSEEATSGIVSVMKAYDIDVSDVLDGIMSKINIVGNTQALDNSDIVAMLQDSVSAMREGNNTLEQTIALETAAYEIMQDRSVGNGFKTVSLRLRGLNEETQEVDDSLKTIKGDLYDLTGVSIMEDADTYKSTYQILKEISDVWDSLTDKTQAKALELMFGKLRANVGASVLKNFDAAEEAMDSMANSAGNAEAEMSIAMDSLDFKINRFKETGTSISQNLFNRDDMKTIVDALTKVAEVIDAITDKAGLLGTVGLGAGLFAGIKNIGKCALVRMFQIIVNCFECPPCPRIAFKGRDVLI